MEHADARELLELAAAEPGGLDRLMAGDTREAATLAGHLAGCPDCTAFMARLRRDAAVIASIVRSTAPLDMRDRTLRYVRAIGRDRSTAPVAGAASPVAAMGDSRPEPLRLRRRTAVLVGLAAVLIAAVAGAGLVVNAQTQALVAARDAEIARQAEIVEALSRVASGTLRVEAQPDARRVELAGAPPMNATGSILFSPASRELVVVATGLSEPAEGREFRCWMEVDGRREPVGRMYFGGDLAYWVGRVETLGGAGTIAQFGVSLVDGAGLPVNGDPVLSGDLRDG